MAQSLTHGRNIFIYNNIRTNQVVYSLTRSLNNNTSLKQLPPLGKNTQPPSLRKDLWTPLAHIHFPHPTQGLLAYRKLLEYRRLHETSYPLSLITQPAGHPHAGQLMSRKSRARVLMDQKANSVADVAAVLLQQETPPDLEREKRMQRLVRRGAGPVAKRGWGSKRVRVPNLVGTVEGVSVAWADLRDAEFAETWPEGVVHRGLERSRYAVAWPAEVKAGEGGGGEEVLMGEGEGGEEGAKKSVVL